jgi:hypothetical protein
MPRAARGRRACVLSFVSCFASPGGTVARVTAASAFVPRAEVTGAKGPDFVSTRSPAPTLATGENDLMPQRLGDKDLTYKRGDFVVADGGPATDPRRLAKETTRAGTFARTFRSRSSRGSRCGFSLAIVSTMPAPPP